MTSPKRTTTFRSPLRALISAMSAGDTIRIGNGPEMTKKEALAFIREQEKEINNFFARRKKPGAATPGKRTTNKPTE